MPKRKTTTTRKRRRTSKTSKRSKKPIGFVKQGKSFKLVFGTKSKPRLSKKSFRTKKSLTKAASKFF